MKMKMKKSYHFKSAVLIFTLFSCFNYSCKKAETLNTTITTVNGDAPQTVDITPVPCNQLKPRPVGMTWRDSLPLDKTLWPKNNGPITNAIFQLNWSDLQPDVYSSGGILDQAASSAATNIRWRLIDDAIDHWKQAGMPGLPLRLYAGINAPKWVKMLGKNECDAGVPNIMNIWVDPDHNGGDSTETAPRYWTQEYIDAHDVLTTRIANRYEGNNYFIAFYAFGAATAFSEYCINGMFRNVDVFRKNGMTTQKMKNAITHFANKYNALFPTTHIILWHSLPGLQGCTDGTGTAPQPVNGVYKMYSDVQFVTDMIKLWRGFGYHAINGSNDLDALEMNSSELRRIVQEGGPIGHQTRKLSSISNVYNTCDKGTDPIGGNATFIELPAGNNLTNNQLMGLTNKAKINNSKLCN